MQVNNNSGIKLLARVNMTKAFRERYIEQGNEPYVKKALVKIADEAGVNLRLSYGEMSDGSIVATCSATPKSRFNNVMRDYYYIYLRNKVFGMWGLHDTQDKTIKDVFDIVFTAIKCSKSKK